MVQVSFPNMSRRAVLPPKAPVRFGAATKASLSPVIYVGDEESRRQLGRIMEYLRVQNKTTPYEVRRNTWYPGYQVHYKIRYVPPDKSSVSEP